MRLSLQNKKYNKYILPFILLVSAIVLVKTIFNGFTNWDDDVYIVNNALLRDFSWDGINKILFSFTGLGGTRLTLLNFWLDYHFWKLNPLPYHLENLIFHLINTALVYYLVKRLCKKDIVAGITALLFAIHPMHVESVAWIAERKDVLYTFFFLLSLISYERYINGSKKILWFTLAFLCFFLSWHSKISAASLPFILIILDYFYSRKLSYKLVIEKIPFFFLLAFYLFHIFTFDKVSGGNFHHFTQSFTFFDRILMAGYSMGFYLLKFFAPFNLYAVHPYPAKVMGSLPVIYYVATVSMIVVFSFIIWILYKYKKSGKEIIFGLLFFLITISMFLHIIPIKGVIVVADRYSYIPYIGLFFIIGVIFENLLSSNKITDRVKQLSSAILVIFFILCAVLAWGRTLVWKDSLTLFTDVINKNPGVEQAYNNRANAKQQIGDYKGALEDYNKSIEINPNFPISYSNRGITRANMNDLANAMLDLNKAIELKSNYDEAYYNRAITKKSLKDYNGLLGDLDLAIKYKPNFAAAYYERGIEKYRRNMQQEALDDCNNAIKYKFNYSEAYYLRGNIMKDMQDFNSAINDYNKAIKINPNYSEAFNNRGFSKNAIGDYQNALSDLDKALELKKDFPEAHNNKGIALANLKKINESIDEFNIAIKLKPDYAEALSNRGSAKAFMQDFKGSIDDFDEVLKIKPNDSLAYINRGNSKFKLNDLKGACDDWHESFNKGFKPAEDLIRSYCRKK
jgi:tetratricopeptide (TPR) repeat protein